MVVTLKDIGVTLVLDFGDATFSQHIITYVAEDLELLNLGECCTFAALLNGLDDGCFEHNQQARGA
tara:strand:- start:55 stop:252 length:198 start_codon:yes stop_codon:yes gene_type:complete